MQYMTGDELDKVNGVPLENGDMIENSASYHLIGNL